MTLSMFMRLALWRVWFWPGDVCRRWQARRSPPVGSKVDDVLYGLICKLQSAHARLLESSREDREQAELLRRIVAMYRRGDDDGVMELLRRAQAVLADAEALMQGFDGSTIQ